MAWASHGAHLMPYCHRDDTEAREAGDLPEGEEILTCGAPLGMASAPVLLTPLRRWPHRHMEKVVVPGWGAVMR